jgi:pre-mRNA-processing factor 6
MFNTYVPSFLNQPAPPNYVAGLGRGASGFTTRSDIGPARATPDIPEGAEGGAVGVGIGGEGEGAGRGRGRGRGRGDGGRDGYEGGGRDDDDERDYSEANYDEFSGYGGNLFGKDPYEKDDAEADKAWEMVDEKLDQRRRARREQRLKEEMERFRAERPKIQQQFSDLKRNLTTVSTEEWDAIPEIGDHSLRFKKRAERYTPAPDSLLERARAEAQNLNVAIGTDTPMGGATPFMGGATPLGDVTAVGSARTTLLNMKLHQASDSVSGQTVVDPKNYLTDLRSMKVNSAAEITDIKRARLLLRSVTTTNPKHAPGWIAAARLEEVAGKLQVARKLISNGCQACPDSEDVWLEAARLNTTENAKIIFAKAVKHLPHSVKIWLAAASLETDLAAKRRIFRRGLDFNRTSVRLWKSLVELEEPNEARLLLTAAVEVVPHSVEMWLALVHLETYDNARKILNQARDKIPTDPQIWITAAKLEETQGNIDGVNAIVRRAIKSLAKQQVLIGRDQWIKEAENCEKSEAIATCQAIIHETIGIGVEDQDRKTTWLEDVESCLAHGCIQTAKAVLARASTVFPRKKSIWLRIAHLEKTHGTKESLEQVLKKAVSNCPQVEILWLMGAKEKWLAGDVAGAREILREAFKCNPNSEQIWLAAVKLESENGFTDKARGLLDKAREMCSTERVWMKSAAFEREVGNLKGSKQILDSSLEKFPKFSKLWMMRGQLEEQTQGKAQEFYQRGLQNCPQSVPLWLCAARWEEKISSTGRARSVLEKARLKNPKTPELWLEAVRVELRATGGNTANNMKMANNLLAKGLQECPTAGILWAQAIVMEPKPKQKAKSVYALKRCDDDPHVLLGVARIFWEDRKLDKARNWFNRAVSLNSDLGDVWAHFYRFEAQHGSEDQRKEVVARCVTAEPRHGEIWTSVAKTPGNARLSVEQTLLKVALLLDSYDPCTGTITKDT